MGCLLGIGDFARGFTDLPYFTFCVLRFDALADDCHIVTRLEVFTGKCVQVSSGAGICPEQPSQTAATSCQSKSGGPSKLKTALAINRKRVQNEIILLQPKASASTSPSSIQKQASSIGALRLCASA